MQQLAPIPAMHPITVSNSGQSDSPNAFVAIFRDGLSKIAEAAQMLKRMYDADFEIPSKIRSIDPNFSMTVFRKLIRVAEKQLMPELLYSEAPAHKRMQALPYVAQVSIWNMQSVELVKDAVSGDAVRVALTDLEPVYLNQVFDATGLRDKDGQRAYLRRQAAPLIEAEDPGSDDGFPFTFTGGSVKMKKDTKFTLTEIKRIVKLMEARVGKRKHRDAA